MSSSARCSCRTSDPRCATGCDAQTPVQAFCASERSEASPLEAQEIVVQLRGNRDGLGRQLEPRAASRSHLTCPRTVTCESTNWLGTCHRQASPRRLRGEVNRRRSMIPDVGAEKLNDCDEVPLLAGSATSERAALSQRARRSTLRSLISPAVRPLHFPLPTAALIEMGVRQATLTPER